MRNILVYRDMLIPASEREFIRRQYIGFDRLTPHFVGCRRDSSFHPAGTPLHLLGGSGFLAPLRQAAFKQLALVPFDPGLDSLAPVLIHAQFGRGGALALPLARHFGIPLVVTFHGGDAFKDKHFQRQAVPTIFQRRWQALIDYAALFVCVAPGVRDKLIERGAPAGKLEVIPIGADGVLPAVPQRAPKHLLFAGRFVSKKGVLVLIDAVRQLRQRGLAVPVVLAGEGPLLDEARGRASDLSDVVFPGWLNPAQLRAAMGEAFALVVPSIVGKDGDKEGLPSVVVEALAVACPVVVSDAAGVAGLDGFEAAGAFVPAGDPVALADALAELVSDPTRRAACEAGALALAQRSFNAQSQSRRLQDRLLDVIAQAGGAI